MAILQKGNKLGVVVHHSVYKPANNLAELKTQATLFNSWHKSKSWAEDTKTPSAYPYISYHYLMATNGEMLKVTDEKYVKYHSGDNFRGDLSFNLHGIAVCLTGNYENDKPTDAQMKALVLFIRDVEKRYDIDARVRGHKETSANATACPGRNIGTHDSGWLKQVISNVNNPNYPPVVKPPEPPKPPELTECEKEVERLKLKIRELELITGAQEGTINDLMELKAELDNQVVNLAAELEVAEEILEGLQNGYDLLDEKYQESERQKLELVKNYNECKKKLAAGQENFIEKILDWVRGVLATILGDRS